jgi:hypothetical protein
MVNASFLGWGVVGVVHEQDDLGRITERLEPVRYVARITQAFARSEFPLVIDRADQDSASDDRECLFDPDSVGMRLLLSHRERRSVKLDQAGTDPPSVEENRTDRRPSYGLAIGRATVGQQCSQWRAQRCGQGEQSV